MPPTSPAPWLLSRYQHKGLVDDEKKELNRLLLEAYYRGAVWEAAREAGRDPAWLYLISMSWSSWPSTNTGRMRPSN